jgi:hypothetical protein
MPSEIHLFEDDLKQKPGKGSNKPPRSIKAKDLDDNFKRITIIENPDEETKTYTVKYDKDGTILTIFPTLQTSGTYVLGTVDGKLQWIATQDCQDTSA